MKTKKTSVETVGRIWHKVDCSLLPIKEKKEMRAYLRQVLKWDIQNLDGANTAKLRALVNGRGTIDSNSPIGTRLDMYRFLSLYFVNHTPVKNSTPYQRLQAWKRILIPTSKRELIEAYPNIVELASDPTPYIPTHEGRPYFDAVRQAIRELHIIVPNNVRGKCYAPEFVDIYPY